jgi:UPF0176 protein
MQLYNTLSAEERSILIDEAGKQRLTLSFYAYAQISNPTQFRNELFLAWNPLGVLGRIYVAHEGINAQLSLPADSFYDFKDSIEQYDFMKGIRLNIAVEQDDYSFLKLTIKVRDKIVADGLEDETFDVTNIGIHLKAKEFNQLVEDPNTIVVDMRNHYESEIGHFIHAIKPDVDTFRESLPIIEEQLSEHKQDKKREQQRQRRSHCCRPLVASRLCRTRRAGPASERRHAPVLLLVRQQLILGKFSLHYYISSELIC